MLPMGRWSNVRGGVDELEGGDGECVVGVDCDADEWAEARGVFSCPAGG